MQVKVEWPAVANIEDARLRMAFERVRCIAGQADVGGAANLGLLAVGGDIGEGTLQPDIQLVTGVAVVGNGVIRWHSQQDLATTLVEIAAQR